MTTTTPEELHTSGHGDDHVGNGDDHGGHGDDHGAGHGEGHGHSSTGLSNNKLAMWLFLGSECLLFGGLISTYMLYRGRIGAGPGPDQVYSIPFTSVSSFVLLMSSLTMVLALSHARIGDEERPIRRGIQAEEDAQGPCR